MMAYDVVLLNGASSAGKTSLARALQDLLEEPWLTFGVDTLITAMPFKLTGDPDGLVFHDDGRIDVGPTYQALEADWRRAIGAMARAGMKIVIDEVMLGGAPDQARWKTALDGVNVLWVGVLCDAAVTSERERARGDRQLGMAAIQSRQVHEGVAYDMTVDTSRASAEDCARRVAERLSSDFTKP